MFTLLIVDDEPLFRKGISQLINMEQLSITKVFEADNGNSALALVKEHRPNIVLADINMPGMDGLLLATSIKQFDPTIKIAIITGYDYFDYAVAALKAKVDDFLLKPVSKADVEKLLYKLGQIIKEEQKQQQVLASVKNITSLSDSAQDQANYQPLIQKILEENYGNSQFSLTVLAETVNLSSGYLSPLFKELFGVTFSDYLLTLRLERAKILLLTTFYKNYEIAEKVGFDDANYFSTAFKKKFGTSPSHYRKNNTGGGK